MYDRAFYYHLYEIAPFIFWPWFASSLKKLEALWYWQSIEMFFWVWECLNFQSIFTKFETAINQAKSLVENVYTQYNFHFSAGHFYIIPNRSESLYSGCCSIWGVHSPIFVASVGGRADFRAALLANGLLQKVSWWEVPQTVCHKKVSWWEVSQTVCHKK